MKWLIAAALCFLFLLSPVLATESEAGQKTKKAPKKQVHIVSLRGANTGAMARKRAWIAEAKLEYLSEVGKNGQESGFEKAKRSGLLVPLRSGVDLRIDNRLPERYRYVGFWVAAYLNDLAKDFRKEFGRPLWINSAFRSVEYQAKIRKGGNHNATKLSPHSTGGTVDIAIIHMSPAQLGWLRKRLLRDEARGLVEATEEKKSQAMMDVFVRKPRPQAPPAKPKRGGRILQEERPLSVLIYAKNLLKFLLPPLNF